VIDGSTKGPLFERLRCHAGRVASFGAAGGTEKPAACFARRVKRVSQK